MTLTREIAQQYQDHAIVSIEDYKIVAKGAFQGFDNLLAVQFIGVESIEDDAFRDCTSLEQVNLCDEITKIGSNAFTNTPIRYAQVSENLKLNQLFANKEPSRYYLRLYWGD